MTFVLSNTSHKSNNTLLLQNVTTNFHNKNARSSSHWGGGDWSWSPWISPLDVGLDLIPLNFPLGCGPGPDPPQFPPWVWAWQEGLLGRGSLLGRGISLAGGVSLAEGGGMPACTEADLSPLWTEWQTGAKILPCPKLRLLALTKCCNKSDQNKLHFKCFYLFPS